MAGPRHYSRPLPVTDTHTASHPAIFGEISVALLQSTASSFLMLGVKLAKLPTLKSAFGDQRKEKSKMRRCTLGRGAQDLREWLESIPDLHQHSSKFEDAGVTGEQLVAVESDGELIELGMQLEIDRKYLLLQLARVRARQNVRRIAAVEMQEMRHRPNSAGAGCIDEAQT